jgi:hypothetical protein
MPKRGLSVAKCRLLVEHRLKAVGALSRCDCLIAQPRRLESSEVPVERSCYKNSKERELDVESIRSTADAVSKAHNELWNLIRTRFTRNNGPLGHGQSTKPDVAPCLSARPESDTAIGGSGLVERSARQVIKNVALGTPSRSGLRPSSVFVLIDPQLLGPTHARPRPPPN